MFVLHLFQISLIVLSIGFQNDDDSGELDITPGPRMCEFVGWFSLALSKKKKKRTKNEIF